MLGEGCRECTLITRASLLVLKAAFVVVLLPSDAPGLVAGDDRWKMAEEEGDRHKGGEMGFLPGEERRRAKVAGISDIGIIQRCSRKTRAEKERKGRGDVEAIFFIYMAAEITALRDVKQDSTLHL